MRFVSGINDNVGIVKDDTIRVVSSVDYAVKVVKYE